LSANQDQIYLGLRRLKPVTVKLSLWWPFALSANTSVYYWTGCSRTDDTSSHLVKRWYHASVV